MDTETTDLTVVCYTRAPLVHDSVEAKIEPLQECESEGVLDTVILRSWPDKVRLEEPSPQQEVLDMFERFTTWADTQGVTIQPPFEVRTTTSLATETTKTILVTPLLTLALYRDDQLFGVFPHSKDGNTYTATEAVAALEAGTLPTPLGTPPAPAPTRTATCPECDGALINGQGLFACGDCAWVGIATPSGRYRAVREGSGGLTVRTP